MAADQSVNEGSLPRPIPSDSVILNQQWIEQTGTGLFPPHCVLSVQRYDRPEIILPAPDEGALGQAVEKRRREFSAGRMAAKAALEKLGFVNPRIPIGEHRNPLWPEGVTGSITHTAGLAVAVVARLEHAVAIGVDLELTCAVKQDLWRSVLTEQEIARVRNEPADLQARAATLIFSAKESFYKMQFPLTGRWVDFHEAEVVVSKSGLFELTCKQVQVTGRLNCITFPGRFAWGPEFTLTAMHLATLKL